MKEIILKGIVLVGMTVDILIFLVLTSGFCSNTAYNMPNLKLKVLVLSFEKYTYSISLSLWT